MDPSRLRVDISHCCFDASAHDFAPRRSSTQRIQQEMLSFEPDLASTEETDSHGNIVNRIVLKPGVSTIRHDALVAVSSYPEHNLTTEQASRVELLPLSLLRYTQPSRYCDSDRLMEFAVEKFGQCVPGAPTVRAICDWYITTSSTVLARVRQISRPRRSSSVGTESAAISHMRHPCSVAHSIFRVVRC